MTWLYNKIILSFNFLSFFLIAQTRLSLPAKDKALIKNVFSKFDLLRILKQSSFSLSVVFTLSKQEELYFLWKEEDKEVLWTIFSCHNYLVMSQNERASNTDLIHAFGFELVPTTPMHSRMQEKKLEVRRWRAKQDARAKGHVMHCNHNWGKRGVSILCHINCTNCTFKLVSK